MAFVSGTLFQSNKGLTNETSPSPSSCTGPDVCLRSRDKFVRRLRYVHGHPYLAKIGTGPVSRATRHHQMAITTSQNTGARMRGRTVVVARRRKNVHDVHHASVEPACELVRLVGSEHAEQRGGLGYSFRV